MGGVHSRVAGHRIRTDAIRPYGETVARRLWTGGFSEEKQLSILDQPYVDLGAIGGDE